jgi:hypothetical protein
MNDFINNPNGTVADDASEILRQLLAFTPPTQLKNMLLDMHLAYLEQRHQYLPVDFDRYIQTFSMLIQFLNHLESEKP